MPHDVIMPALGMAQDTGLLVAWRMAAGDAVAVGDVLFEVETDKATMEVEATHAGFLSAVTAAAGQDVPVGHVIARLVATEAEVVAAAAPQATAPAPVPAPGAVTAPAMPPVPDVAAPAPRRDAPQTTPGRILASPKARRLAAERGLDLARLAGAGVPQPYHVADLDRLPAVASGSRAILTARADATALNALLAKASPATDRPRLYAAFATGAWRVAMGGDLAVTLLRPDGTRDTMGGEGVKLSLADLTATRLTGYVPQAAGMSLCVARDGGAISLTLAFGDGDLAFPAAVGWLDELAARIEDPVRQLV